MFKQIEAANINTEETLEDVLADFRLDPYQTKIISEAANKALRDITEPEKIAEFLTNLRSKLEVAQKPIVDSHIQDIISAVRSTVTGKKLGFYSHELSTNTVEQLAENLAA